MSDLCPEIWNLLRDAIIVTLDGEVPGDVVLESDCDYLRERFKSQGDRFFLTIRGCSRFAYTPWSSACKNSEAES